MAMEAEKKALARSKKIREDLKKKREAEVKAKGTMNLTQPVSGIGNLSASGKASVLRKNAKGIRQDIKKNPLISDDELSTRAFLQSGSERLYNAKAVRRMSAANDYDKTASRLESSKNRSETSAKYRLAKMKADNKARKAARKAGKMDPDAQPGFKPAPFLTKNKTKGKK